MANTNQENAQIAQTILSQMGGAGKLQAMTGAKNFTAIENGLRFRFSNFGGQVKYNFCEVTLRDDDTYDMSTCMLRKRNGIARRTNENLDSGIYCDMLKPCFEATTGLRLSLF